jgi:hypothetical protein
MIDKDKERWLKLCEQAANEQDPEKLMHGRGNYTPPRRKREKTQGHGD